MSQNEALRQLGWRDFFTDQLDDADLAFIPARVVRQDLNRYQLVTAADRVVGRLKPRSRLGTEIKSELPTVGDWVMCSLARDAEPGALVVERRLQRFSKFSRKEAGDGNQEQVVAANINTVFLVTGLDDNFNPGRVERYLLLAQNSGATPVIVLNKADLCADLERCQESLSSIAMGTAICPVSAITGTGMEALWGYLQEGETAALLGSSGVGKSTIINALLGYERFRTGSVREGDSKGRHTTTFKELCRVPAGGMLIDTPGMREIQLWTDREGLSASYGDIDQLAAQCRFNDCTHHSEPGCAVKSAIKQGGLDPSRINSYRKFQRELENPGSMQDAGLYAGKQRQRSKFTRVVHSRPNKRD